MNWYKKASFVDCSQELIALLSWLYPSNSLIKESQYWSRDSGGHLRSDPVLDAKIVSLFDTGHYSRKGIMKRLNISRGIVDGALIRNHRIQRNTRSSTKGMLNDKMFVDKIKELSNSTNPQTGKNYNKTQIAKALGVSYQTVDRVMSTHIRSSPRDIVNYVAYKFWETYHSGMPNMIRKMPISERMPFVNNFIDSVIAAPKEREQAKEILFNKLNFRNRMMNLDTTQEKLPVSGPFGKNEIPMQPFDDNRNANPSMMNNTGSEVVKPNVSDPTENNAWSQRQENNPSLIERYQRAGKSDLINKIFDEYKKGLSAINIAKQNHVSFVNVKQIIEEMQKKTNETTNLSLTENPKTEPLSPTQPVEETIPATAPPSSPPTTQYLPAKLTEDQIQWVTNNIHNTSLREMSKRLGINYYQLKKIINDRNVQLPSFNERARQTAIKQWQSPTYKKKLDESRERQRQVMQKLHQDPSFQEKSREAVKERWRKSRQT